jgi:flagellar biogenesis protein FliO
MQAKSTMLRVVWILTGLVSPGLAQDSLSVQTSDTTFSGSPLVPMYNPIDMGAFLMKSILILAVLTLALYFGLKLYRHFAHSQGFSRNPYGVRILSSSMLAPKKSIHMLKVLDHLLLVGVTDNQISLLMDIPFSELDEETKKSVEIADSNRPTPFNNILQDLMKRIKN